jgi:hypothetical protein
LHYQQAVYFSVSNIKHLRGYAYTLVFAFGALTMTNPHEMTSQARRRPSALRIGAVLSALAVCPFWLGDVVAEESSSVGASTSYAAVDAMKPKFDMVDAAARYVAFVREADRMTRPNALASESIASALTNTSRVSAKEITEGVGAYATLSVANDPAFRAGIETAVGLLGREAALTRLKESPATFLTMISGSNDAHRVASGAIANSTAKLEAAQSALNDAAYALQKERWAMQAVDTQATLAAHRAAAASPSGLTPFAPSDLPATASEAPVNSRYVLAASYHLLGDDVSATALLDKPLGRMCMNRVQLNVRQCIAASRFPFEHAFCLSQHSFGEANGCVKDSVK